MTPAAFANSASRVLISLAGRFSAVDARSWPRVAGSPFWGKEMIRSANVWRFVPGFLRKKAYVAAIPEWKDDRRRAKELEVIGYAMYQLGYEEGQRVDYHPWEMRILRDALIEAGILKA